MIWLSGDEAGIYAVGRVMTEPVRREDSIIGIGYWKNPLEGLKVKARVKVRYENVFLDKPLKKQYLQNDDELSELKILHCAMGTNFAVTNDQWCAIHHWLDDLLY